MSARQEILNVLIDTKTFHHVSCLTIFNIFGKRKNLKEINAWINHATHTRHPHFNFLQRASQLVSFIHQRLNFIFHKKLYFHCIQFVDKKWKNKFLFIKRYWWTCWLFPSFHQVEPSFLFHRKGDYNFWMRWCQWLFFPSTNQGLNVTNCDLDW